MIKSDQSGLYQNYDMDKVFIKNLQVETIIGIFEWEREVRQVVSIDLEMEFDNKKAAKSMILKMPLRITREGKEGLVRLKDLNINWLKGLLSKSQRLS